MSGSKSLNEFAKQVREACKHYDKPARIGKLPIAGVALQALLLEHPAHGIDLVGRGEALQQVIEHNVEQLKPDERHGSEAEIYLCLYSYVHGHDPYTHTPIDNVHAYLESHYQIPKSSYHRRQREGLARLSGELSSDLAERTTWLEPIPSTKGFVGREEELLYYGSQLEEDGLAVIEGVGGIGKTTLGARLAMKITARRPVCWLTIRAGVNDTPKALLYGWAAFLAQQNYAQLWAFMRATANEETSLDRYFPLLSQGLAKVQPLLCLDNLESMPDKEDAFWSLLDMVQKEARSFPPQHWGGRKGGALLLISQRRPPLAFLGDYRLLSGLSSIEVQRLMAQRGMELTEEQAEMVTSYTLGNARLLELWNAHMRMYSEQGEAEGINSLANLGDSQAASTFLSTQIITALTPAQQRAASLLALSRRPVDGFLLQTPPKGVQPLSDFEIEASDYTKLDQLGLIKHHLGNQWSLSPLLNSHLTHPNHVILSPSTSLRTGAAKNLTDDLIDLHQWLSRLYISQGNLLEAAYHAIESEEPAQAILWLAEQQQVLIRQGHASAMNSLLRSIQAADLSPFVRQIWRDLRGELALLEGDYEAAQAEADANAREASTISAQAQAEWQKGIVAKARGKAWQAGDHYQQALRLLAIKDISLETWLHRELAWTALEQNNIEAAKEQLEQAHMALHNMWGILAEDEGNLDKALEHYEQALTIAQKQDDVRQLMRVRNNLALLYQKKNQLEEAIAAYQENLQSTEQIGERVGQAITLLNIGFCYTELGENEAAIKHMAQALPIFSQLGDAKGQLLTHLNLAKGHLQLNQLEAAQQHAQTAAKTENEQVSKTGYAEALRIYAEVLLAKGDLTSALTTAEQALAARRQPNAPDSFFDPYYAKLTCETLVRIHTALGNTAEAEKYNSLAEELGRKIKE